MSPLGSISRLFLPSVLFLLGITMLGCNVSSNVSQAEPGDVEFRKLAGDVWMHTTYRVIRNGQVVPVNGLVLKSPAGAVVVDTGYTESDLTEIVEWAEASVGEVVAIIVTRSEEDRSGAIELARKREIPTYAFRQPTAQYALEGYTLLERWGIDGELYFPGTARSEDNLVLWLRDPQLLFAGNVVDEAPADSSSVLRRLNLRYRGVRVVVPGHGVPGDGRLLEPHLPG